MVSTEDTAKGQTIARIILEQAKAAQMTAREAGTAIAEAILGTTGNRSELVDGATVEIEDAPQGFDPNAVKSAMVAGLTPQSVAPTPQTPITGGWFSSGPLAEAVKRLQSRMNAAQEAARNAQSAEGAKLAAKQALAAALEAMRLATEAQQQALAPQIQQMQATQQQTERATTTQEAQTLAVSTANQGQWLLSSLIDQGKNALVSMSPDFYPVVGWEDFGVVARVSDKVLFVTLFGSKVRLDVAIGVAVAATLAVYLLTSKKKSKRGKRK